MITRLLFILTTLASLTLTSISFGQAPNLGTASSFALFTKTGAVTNVGSSTVVGDVGFNTGSYSGFPTATVTGEEHLGDPFSTTVAADVVTAYNALVATPCGTILSSPELGSQTLTAGVYCQITALPTTLTGTLTLSGPGVFIFKLSSALTTADLSSIVLTNGATANNVYFQILGAATIGVTPTLGGAGTGSNFVGTILAMGAIVLNNTTLQGRALSTVGAITVIESRINVPSVIIAIPDLTPIIYARPSTVYNTTNISVVVEVYELLSVPTAGLITVKVPKDARFVMSFDPTALSVNGRSVQNSAWTYLGLSGGSYTFTTTNVIAGNVGTGKLSFGMTGTLTPGATTGTLTVNAVIVGGSGGEIRIDNDNDADRIDYFQQQ